MKALLFFILISLLVEPAISQDITVLDVHGKVTRGQKELKENDKITADDGLRFGSSEDYVVVLYTPTGNVYRIPELNDAKKDKLEDFIFIVKDYIFPETSVTGTKGNTDWEKEFGFNYYIFKESRVVFDAKQYFAGTNSYFILKQLSGKNLANHKLPVENDSLLVINTNTSGVSDSAYVELTYSHGRQDLLCRFYLVFLDSGRISAIRNELSALKAALTSLKWKDTDIYQTLGKYLRTYYGNFNEYDLNAFFKEQLQTK